MSDYIIVPALESHCDQLARNMRQGDKAEVHAAGMSSIKAVRRAFRASTLTRSAFVDGEIAAMWGLGGNLVSEVGHPWLLTTPAIERVPRAFVREGKNELTKMLRHRSVLSDYVDAKYTGAVRLLEVLGFSLGHPEPRGLRGQSFRQFSIDRDIYFARQKQTRVVRAESAPFIIHTLGRSRTAWLSSFLTYGKVKCFNEHAVRLRSVDEAVDFLTQGNVGAAETGAAPGWQLIRHYIPSVKTVVIRRDPEDVIRSFARSEIAHIASVDEGRLRKVIAYEDRCLDEIEKQPNTLSFSFDDLKREAVCAAIFEHCLPYKFDRGWWQDLREKNIQADVAEIVAYYHRNRDDVESFKRQAKRRLIELARAGKIKSH